MIKGIMSGTISGAVVSCMALSVVSLMSEQPAGNAPPQAPLVQAPQVDVDSTQVAGHDSVSNPDLNQDEVISEPPIATIAASPNTDSDIPLADTSPAQVPQTASVETQLGSPDAGPSPDLVASIEQPVLPNPLAAAPNQPINEDDLSISTEPAQPAPPAVEPAEIFVVDNIDPVIEPEITTQALGLPSDTTPIAPVTIVDAAPQIEIAAQPDLAVEPPTQDLTAHETPEDPIVAAPVTTPAPRVLSLSASADNGDTTSSLPTGDQSITIRRPGDVVTVSDSTAEIVILNEGPALEIYAAEFDNPEAKPEMSIVLIDDGTVSNAVTVLQTLPFAVTIALDPARPDAPQAMASYRDAGFETIAIVNLPQGATTQDVAVGFEATFAQLPETVAILDSGIGGLPNDPGALRQAMALLSEDGRGFISVSKGLNPAEREAARAEVSAAIVYRDLDSDGQDARVIRRFLDQAAFRSRQESGVVLLARMRPETISALILWGTGNRAEQVAMAPASAVLSTNQ